jgi:hypothetical protein
LEFKSYSQDFEPLVKNFNLRLRKGGEALAFPECHIPRFPYAPDRHPYQEMFLLIHKSQVRGAYLLTHERFSIHGSIKSVACGPQFSLSEGAVSREYGMVGGLLVEHALSKQPLMYALGIGGMNERLAKVLLALHWTLYPLPFYFRVTKTFRFFADMSHLRRNRRHKICMDALRFTGVGPLGIRMAQLRLADGTRACSTEVVSSFSTWADEIWNTASPNFSLISDRESATLNRVYSPSDPRFHRLKVESASGTVGWAIVLDTRMSGHKQFGNLRVGSLVDCFALQGHEGMVAKAATDFLERRDVDLIVSNQANTAWGKALLRAGYLRGPSNFVLGLSPELSKLIGTSQQAHGKIHMNRGNGDGPIHL